VTANSILAFSALAAILTVLPGSDVAFTLRSTLRNGPGHGLAAAVGISSGVLCWAAASGVGLVELLHASRIGYDAVRVAGAIYLIFLGVQSLRGSGRSRDTPALPAVRDHGEPPGQDPPERRERHGSRPSTAEPGP